MNARAIALVTVFLLIRIALLAVREPFFDELFTVWMAGRPLGAIVPALLADSGPPLYYFLARVPDVFVLRALSLVFSTVALLLVWRKSPTAALLLAFYPPAALFAADARAYALCALFVAVGTIAIAEDRPFVAAGAMLLAAYSHWYGALLLPVVLFAKPRGRAAAAFAAACVLFVPGLILASRQPAEAMGWMGGGRPLEALQELLFVGRYAEALFQPAPMALTVVSGIALLVALVMAAFGGVRLARWRPAAPVLVPVLLAVAFAIGGRNVYFPMRFESVLAVPLVLWLAASLEGWPRTVRLVLISVLCMCGAAAIAIGTVDHANRPLDSYREAAQALRPGEPVVATGYLYLEAYHRLGGRYVRPYPAEQGRHPGWRVPDGTYEPLPGGTFTWIVERGAPELRLLRRPPQVLFANDRALILRVANFHP